MGSPSSDFARLLTGADALTIEFARQLLESEGIPSFAHGQDFDVAEFGRAGHDTIRHQDLFVPHGALARAREVLTLAWGELPDSAEAE